MKVILGTDSLQVQLTGIGRYTLELLRGLTQHEDISELKCFDMGLWRLPSDYLSHDGIESKITASSSLTASIRSRLSRLPVAVRAFEIYSSHIMRHILNKEADGLFHSPNFHLPKFDGYRITTVHDLSFVHYPQYHPKARIEWMQRMVPNAIIEADAVITDSQSIRDEIIKHYGIANEKVFAVPLGVDPYYKVRDHASIAKFLIKQNLEYQSYFLCVATIEPRKNIDGLLTSYLNLPRSLRLKCPLVLIGAYGWHSDELHQRIRDCQTEGVRYLGYLDKYLLPKIYNGAMAFVFPSFYEGYGLPVAEAQASGLPVITSNVSSLAELASHYALTVTPGDIDALTLAMLKAFEDQTWRDQCKLSGLIKSTPMTWSKCIENTLSVYRTVLNS